jgi:hypothetical protein
MSKVIQSPAISTSSSLSFSRDRQMPGCEFVGF